VGPFGNLRREVADTIKRLDPVFALLSRVAFRGRRYLVKTAFENSPLMLHNGPFLRVASVVPLPGHIAGNKADLLLLTITSLEAD
jgi:hypothetical protein